MNRPQSTLRATLRVAEFTSLLLVLPAAASALRDFLLWTLS